LLLKGARTVIAQAGEATAINSTGNPGMASGGMGDVLTGLCAALHVATGSSFRAACLGAWLTGRSADLLIDSGARSIESLSAVDVAEGLGAAFDDLRSAGAGLIPVRDLDW
jgi:NAD(P)H-hydrate epimerase